MNDQPKILTRRELFELWYTEQNDIPFADFAQYRLGETYRLPALARAYRNFNAGWFASEAHQHVTGGIQK